MALVVFWYVMDDVTTPFHDVFNVVGPPAYIISIYLEAFTPSGNIH
jgi:hypothetical protein